MLFGKNEDIYDTSGHGTACASMIVSECPYVDIVSIGILDGNGKSNLAALEFALESLINSDVSIINMSLAFNILVDQKLYRIRKSYRNKMLLSLHQCQMKGMSVIQLLMIM
ncbi:MAG: S8 family serine peptidase [Ruminococcus sp.]